MIFGAFLPPLHFPYVHHPHHTACLPPPVQASPATNTIFDVTMAALENKPLINDGPSVTLTIRLIMQGKVSFQFQTLFIFIFMFSLFLIKYLHMPGTQNILFFSHPVFPFPYPSLVAIFCTNPVSVPVVRGELTLLGNPSPLHLYTLSVGHIGRCMCIGDAPEKATRYLYGYVRNGGVP